MKSAAFFYRQNFFEKSMKLTCMHPKLRAAIALSAVFVVSACGGSGGDTTTSGSDGLIPGGPTGADATGIADDQLQKMAASRAGAGLGVNLANLSRLSDQTQSDLETGSFAGDLPADNNTDALDSFESSNSNFLNNSLGVDDPGAMTTREGNFITIDPDDQTVCGGEVPLLDGFTDDLSQCQQLVTDLIVTIDARTEESGIITYLYQDAPLLLIGYSPMGASYELKLDGLQRVITSNNQLSSNGAIANEDVIMSGAVRLSGTVLNSETGSVAGELSLQVTEALLLGSSGTEASISLQPSTVFEMSLNEATGDVSMGVNWGALQVIAASGDSDGNSSLAQWNLGGLTGALNFNENQRTFQVENIGIGNVPMTITIDSVESVNMTLASFGIMVDSETGLINLDGALNVSLALNNIAGLFEDQASDFSATAGISAPANSSFARQNNGSTMVSTGGPLSVTLIGGDGQSSGQSEVIINAGECFGSDNDSENTNDATSILASVPCN